MVKTYSLKKDGETQLSKNFKVREFYCHDGSDKILIDTELVEILQSIRDAFGKPITINSAYRNATYNKKIGGAKNSQHVYGKAADIRVNGVPPFAVAAWMERHIESAGKHTCGYYPIQLFCHVDSRSAPTLFQEYSRGKTRGVSTFGFGTKYEQYLKEEEEVTQEQFNSMMDAYLAEKAKENPSEWSQEARDWAVNNGIVEGDGNGTYRWKSAVTREEMAQMLMRLK